MKKVFGLLLVFCLLAVTVLFLPACQKKEGQLPTLQVGDQWVWSYTIDETTSIITEEIIGEETVEGRECHVIDMVFDPPMSWTQGDMECNVSSMKYWGDKATGLLGVKHETSTTCNGQVYTSTEIYSYDPWTPLFPLEIGKEVEMEKTTTTYSNGEQTGDPVVGTETYEVESKEDLTVAAGTFSCWKITMYDSANDITQTMWWSDDAKTIVKMTDADGNTIMELQSYSIN